MEKEKNSDDIGRQYLYALLTCAEWVEEAYRQIARKNQKNREVLKELYMCACDDVPIEKVIEAQKQSHPEEALKFLRRKYMEDSTLDEYHKELTGIRKVTAGLEKEIGQMSGLLKHIAGNVSNFGIMFQEEGEIPKEISDELSFQEMYADMAKTGSGTNQEQQKVKLETDLGNVTKENDVPKSGTKTVKKKRKRSRCFLWRRKEQEPAEFIEKSLIAGYEKEQLEYLLDCMEEGVPLEIIDKFASPKLPVEVMKRLRVLEERKEQEKWSRIER